MTQSDKTPTPVREELHQLNVRMPRRTVDGARRVADLRGLTLTQLINGLVEAEVRREGDALLQKLQEEAEQAQRVYEEWQQELADAEQQHVQKIRTT